MTLSEMSFILGGLLVAVAVPRGGIEIRELKIPQVGRSSRLLIAGIVFVGLAVTLNTNPSAVQTNSHAGAKSNSSTAPGAREGECLTQNRYQQAFDKRAQKGFYPDKIAARCENGSEQFRVGWKGIPSGAAFYSYNAITKQVYDGRNRELASPGYSVEFLNAFKDC